RDGADPRRGLRRRRAAQHRAGGAARLGVRGLKGASQLASGPDSELGVHVAQVPLDGPRAEEQASADVRVREPVASQLTNLTLLCGEIVAGLGDDPAALLASRDEFSV